MNGIFHFTLSANWRVPILCPLFLLDPEISYCGSRMVVGQGWWQKGRDRRSKMETPPYTCPFPLSKSHTCLLHIWPPLFPRSDILFCFISHEQHCSAQMAGWLEWMPLAEVVPDWTFAFPFPHPKPSSGHFFAAMGIDDMSLGCGTLALQGGISSHGRICLVFTPVSWSSMGPETLVSKPNSFCWIRCCLSSLSPLRKKGGEFQSFVNCGKFGWLS